MRWTTCDCIKVWKSFDSKSTGILMVWFGVWCILCIDQTNEMSQWWRRTKKKIKNWHVQHIDIRLRTHFNNRAYWAHNHALSLLFRCRSRSRCTNLWRIDWEFHFEWLKSDEINIKIYGKLPFCANYYCSLIIMIMVMINEPIILMIMVMREHSIFLLFMSTSNLTSE